MDTNYLGGPVREALLLGVDNLMEGSTRLGKPVLVTSTVGVPGRKILLAEYAEV